MIQTPFHQQSIAKILNREVFSFDQFISLVKGRGSPLTNVQVLHWSKDKTSDWLSALVIEGFSSDQCTALVRGELPPSDQCAALVRGELPPLSDVLSFWPMCCISQRRAFSFWPIYFIGQRWFFLCLHWLPLMNWSFLLLFFFRADQPCVWWRLDGFGAKQWVALGWNVMESWGNRYTGRWRIDIWSWEKRVNPFFSKCSILGQNLSLIVSRNYCCQQPALYSNWMACASWNK